METGDRKNFKATAANATTGTTKIKVFCLSVCRVHQKIETNPINRDAIAENKAR